MKTDGETRRLGRLGLVGLLGAVIIAVLAPVVGGLDGFSENYASVRLEPGASVPLVAHHEVALDSGDGTTRIGGCSIVGPGTWSYQIVAAGSTTDFQTGPKGDYKITCKGGAVEVEDDAGGHPAADASEHHGHRLTIGMFAIAGVIALASLGVLITSGRAGGRRRMADGPDRAEVDADEPKAH